MHSQVREWLQHPVTQAYLRILKEHRDSHIQHILNMGPLNPENLGELSQLKGQINTLDLMLDQEKLDYFFEGELRDAEV